MFKIAGKIIDAHDLLNSPVEAHKEAAVDLLRNAPDFVKQAQLFDQDQIERLPDAFFGLILTEKTATRRLFPVPDRAHAWLQLATLDKLAGFLPEQVVSVAAYGLKQAAGRYGLEVSEKIAACASDTPCTNRLDTILIIEQPQKLASDQDDLSDVDYALVVGDRRRYPIHTPELVKRAMEYFGQFEYSFALPDRYAFARAVVDRAQKFAMEVPEHLAKCAADTYAEALGEMLNLRRRYASDADKQALDMLERHRDQLDAVKFAELLHDWDEATEVAERHRLPNAYESTLSQEKNAGHHDGLAVETILRGVVKHEEKLARYLGIDLIRQLKEFPAETYEALGEDAQEVLHNVIAGAL